RPDPGRSQGGGDRHGRLLRDAVAPPARAPIPRLRAGLAAGDRTRCAGELLDPALGGNRRSQTGADRRRRADGSSRRGAMIPFNRHRIWNILADAALIALAWLLAFWLRFDHGVPAPYHRLMVDTIAIVVVVQLTVFVVFGFYNRWWRYVSTRDMWGAARGVTVACAATDLIVLLAHP